MALDMTKVNAVITGLETTAKTLVKVSIPVAVIMVILEVIFGVSIGLVPRIISLLGMTVKDIILYGFGAFVVYKTFIK
jgi:hypothetical protein